MDYTFRTSTEIAEFYINSGKREKSDISLLINTVAKSLVNKIGKESALKICTPFMSDKEHLFSFEGFKSFIEKTGVLEISLLDPMNGKVIDQPFIYF